jgi:fibronectin-binding autotransporter adhesin
MKARLATRLVTILLVVMNVGGLRSQAQTAVSWLPGTGPWSAPGFWTGDVVPNNGGGKTYNVTISNGEVETVTLNLGVTISDLTMGDEAILQSVANDSLTIASGGTFTIASGSTVNFSTAGSDITIDSGGTLTNNGTLNLLAAGETLKVTGTTTNGTGAGLDITGGTSATFTGNVTNSGTFETGSTTGSNTVTVTGTFTNNAGSTLQLNGSGDVANINALSNSGTLVIGTGATLNITGGGSGLTDIVAGSTVTLDGSLNVVNGSVSTNGLAKLTTVAGTLNLQNNQTTTITPTGGTLTIASGGEVELSGASPSTTTLSITGNVSSSGDFETGFQGGKNIVNVSGTFTTLAGSQTILYGTSDVVNAGVLSNSGLLQIGNAVGSGATVNITGGGKGVTDIVAGSQIDLFGNLNVINSGVSTNALASLTTVAGTLNLEGKTMTVTPTAGTLTIASGGLLELSGTDPSTTTLSITGSVSNSGQFETGFTGGTNTVNVSGTFTTLAGSQTIVYGTSDVVNVNALSNSGTLEIGTALGSGATVNITGGGKGVTDIVAGSTIDLFGNFNVINGGVSTNALASLTTVAGTLDLEGKTMTVTPTGGTLTVASTGLLELSGSVASTSTLSITGNVTSSGDFETGFAGGTNTVNVSGTFTTLAGSQTIVYGTSDVMNVNALSNSGILEIGDAVGSGATFNITGGGKGVTDIVAGSTIELFGNFNVINSGVSTNALASLTTVAGTLELNNSKTTSITPSGSLLTIASTGLLELSGADASTTTLSITGSVNNSGDVETGFSGGTNTVNVSGTFTNNAGAFLDIYAGVQSDGVGTDLVNIPTLSNAGTVVLFNAGATLDITGTGTLTNSGNIDIEAGTLKFSSATATLTGGGTVTLGNSAATETGKIQVGSSDTGTLTNSNNTITGYGNLGNGTLTLVNHGTINANGNVSSGTLTVQPGSAGMTNTGTLEATNQATLVLEGTFNNTGTIEALGEINGTVNPTVELAAGTVINGGTLTTTTVGTNSGIIEGTGAVTLNGVTNSGTYAVNAGTTTTLKGTVANSGSITLSGSTLSMGNSVTLDGNGKVVLSNSATNLITGATSGLTLTNASTIEGAGTISNLGIVNTGTILANQSTTLTILPSSAGLNNKGTLSVSAGDAMVIGTAAGGALLNFSGTTLTGGTYAVSGTLEFGASGASVVTDAANISLTGSAAKIVNFAGQNVLTDLATITSAGSFTLSSGADFTTVGNFTNDGTLTVNSGSKFTVLSTSSLTNFNSATNTLTGGTYTVGGDLLFAGANIVTDAAHITLEGTGEIENSTTSKSGLANLATITSAGSFTLASAANFTTVGNFTNNGTLTVNSGSKFTVLSTSSLTNFDSTNSTLTGGIYTVAGDLLFAGANIVTDAANITLEGAGEIENSTTSTSGLANLATITSDGSFTLASAANFTTVGNLTNNGKLTVNSGSTLTVTGDLTNFDSATNTLASGTYTVGGTLEFTGANIVTNAANLTISGTTAKILNGTANGLANFAKNTGTFTVTGDETFTTGSAAFTNSGALDVVKGSTVTVGGADSYTQSAGTTTVDGTLSASTITVTGGNILGAGTLKSSVTVGGSGTAPTISAGDSGKAGLLAITGSYTQLSTATMSTFIGGTTLGTLYSQLQVTGSASLAGTLTVALASGFTPAIGSTFTVLTAGSVTGTFSDSEIAINSSEHFNVSYTTTGVVLTVASGAAVDSDGSKQSSVAAAVLAKLQPVLTSGLRHSVAGNGHVSRPIFVAGMGSRTRSGAGLTSGFGLSGFEGPNRMPVRVATWERTPSLGAVGAQLPRSVERVSPSLSGNWNEPASGISTLRMPLKATLMPRTPAKILPSMLPRLGR